MTDLFEAQRDRAILWAPAAVMAGAALYYSAPRAPPIWLGALALCLGAALAYAALAWPARRGAAGAARLALFAAAIGAACVGAGLAAGAARERLLQAPRIAAVTAPVVVEGWVAALDQGSRRPRLTIRVHAIEGMKTPPRLVRVSTTAPGALAPGRGVRCRAVLHPPDGPLAPGAYDGAYDFYFAGIGGGGFSFGPCRPADPPARMGLMERAHYRLTAFRRAITETVFDAAPGRGGAAASALITGDMSGIDPATMQVFRNSGLAHLLAVSGFNMSLVAGMIFGGVHLALALAPGFALRFPIRKWAAAAAIAGGTIYLALSGMSVPAVRAYVMTLVALWAVLIDRPAITMRSLAVSALAVTLLAPESVLTPGFQMSFAATATLVAAFETYKGGGDARLPNPGLLVSALQASWRWIAGALTASAVAGLATDPFALAHFQRLSIYALPANLAATPIISLVVTPAAAAAGLLAPFGLAGPALAVMGWGLDLLIAIGAAFADRPEAMLALPAPPGAALGLWALAIAWACLWRGALRWTGLAIFAAGLALYAAAPRPALLVDGALKAIVSRDGSPGAPAWIAVGGRPGAFARERLGELAGLRPDQAVALAEPAGCGESLCAWNSPRGRTFAFLRDGAAYAAFCTPGAVVIAKAPAPPGWAARCRPAALIDGADAARHGGAAIYETNGAVTVRRVYPPGRARAWDGASVTDSSE